MGLRRGNPRDERVGPLNRLADVLDDRHAFGERLVLLIPPLASFDHRRPGLPLPVGEEPLARALRRSEVYVAVREYDLQVDEVAHPVARPGDRVQLLGHLVLQRHEWRLPRAGEAECCERHVCVFEADPVRCVGVAYLVVSYLERDCAPRLAEIGEPYVERPHDVLLRHVPRVRGLLGDDPPREALPAAGERRPEEIGVGGGVGGGRGVEVGGVACPGVAVTHLDGAPSLHDPVGQHPRDDGVGHERAQPHVGGLVAPALPADCVVEVAHAVRPLRVHESSSLRSSISPLVMYPS